jgi:hypothetical protein
VLVEAISNVVWTARGAARETPDWTLGALMALDVVLLSGLPVSPASSLVVPLLGRCPTVAQTELTRPNSKQLSQTRKLRKAPKIMQALEMPGLMDVFDSRRLHFFPNHVRDVAQRQKFCALLVPQPDALAGSHSVFGLGSFASLRDRRDHKKRELTQALPSIPGAVRSAWRCRGRPPAARLVADSPPV